MQSNTGRATYQANLRQALMAGAVAGMAVDTALYPLGIMTFNLSILISKTPFE